MLFHAAYDEQGDDVYIMQTPIELSGALRVADLRRAAELLIERHGSLRAGFLARKSGEALQVIARSVRFPWSEVDLTELDAEGQRAELSALMERDQLTRFNLAIPPLVRFTLVKLAEDQHLLLLTNHHIVLDGWSLPHVVEDLFDLYARGDAAVARPRPRPFQDYLAWLAAQDRDAAAAAWRQTLAGVEEPSLVARAEVTRGAMRTRRVSIELLADATSKLSGFAREHALTLNTVIQGAWALLLSQLLGQQDVIFGTASAGRPPELPGVEAMVGLFINTVPVRVRLLPDEPFVRLLERLQDEQSALIAHQHLGLAEIQRVAGLGELFDTAVVFENLPAPPGPVEGTQGELRIAITHDEDSTSGAMHYPLGLLAYPGQRLRLDLSYRPDVLNQEAVRRLADRLHHLLLAVIADPSTMTGRLETLAPAERAKILREWNDTDLDVSAELQGSTLAELFAQQAARTPDATALVAEGRTMTYRELDDRSTRLAQALRAAGAGPSQIVGISLPRSFELLIALQAVLKAGAAYLPLDSSLPTDRLQYMMEDAAPILVISPDSYELLTGRQDNPEQAVPLPNLDPRHPAYVIYTSGSTGRPKGVLVPHAGVVNHIKWKQSQYPLAAGDRVLHKTPTTFDVSVWELFWPLIAGATLVIARPAGHKDPEYLAELISREKVGIAHFVPTMLEPFLRLPEAAGCTTLSRVICSGEALSQDLADRFHAVLDAELYNLYGPTEAAVEITSWRSEAGAGGATVPIGRPIANSQTYVLDAALRPVPVGAPGELYLAGVQLAHGYLGRPDLTSERFVANPFGSPGTRMYRTGDLVRWTEDGALVFLGRTDDQVKIRGLRIELGEIEARLTSHSAVKLAAVTVREDRPGVRQLIAYIVGRDGEPPSDDLREHLASQLPDYMVPQAFVSLPDLPMTASGKLDRRNLPAPHFHASDEREPTGPYEEQLCGLFADVLSLDRVGPDDNFFSLGGDSLLALRLGSRMQKALARRVPIRMVFESPTPARLATQLLSTDAD
jgi:amino acid adenylation domain-containing protein